MSLAQYPTRHVKEGNIVKNLKPFTATAILIAAMVSACGTQAPPPTPMPTPLPTTTPTPKPAFEIAVSDCGYNDSISVTAL